MLTETYYLTNLGSLETAEVISYAHNNPNILLEIQDAVKNKFNWTNYNQYEYISMPWKHPVLNENVITGELPQLYTISYFQEAVMCFRQLCLTSLSSYVEAIVLLDNRPEWMPNFCKPMFKSVHYNEYGRPFPELADNFSEYYFSGNSEQVETYFNLPVNRGSWETRYSAIVSNNQTVSVKQHCYTDTGKDWDVIYAVATKRAGKKYLLYQS